MLENQELDEDKQKMKDRILELENLLTNELDERHDIVKNCKRLEKEVAQRDSEIMQLHQHLQSTENNIQELKQVLDSLSSVDDVPVPYTPRSVVSQEVQVNMDQVCSTHRR